MADRVGGQLGSYRLTRLLGKGGFAEVYLGEHVHLRTLAAIKVLRAALASEEAEAFQREAQLIARLDHAHIVRVLDFDVQDGLPFLVMEYASQGTLRARHPRGIALPLETALAYVQQVGAALQYAHDQKLVHRDVKPENMLLGEGDAVLLSDFGIAVVSQSSRYQNPQEVVGTVTYMAPEQIQAHPRPASDQYSFGVVIYEWLTGQRPFTGSMTEVATKHLVAQPPPLREKLPSILPAVEEVVLTALAKDPRERFGSLRAFVHAFETACRGGVFVAPPRLPGDSMSQPMLTPPAGVLAAPPAEWPVEAAPPAEPEPTAPTSQPTPPLAATDLTTPMEADMAAELAGHKVSRRAALVGLGVAALALAGGGVTWFALTRQEQPPQSATRPTLAP